MTGSVRVLYGQGCGVSRCEPSTIRIVNEWFGYELRIEKPGEEPVVRSGQALSEFSYANKPKNLSAF